MKGFVTGAWLLAAAPGLGLFPAAAATAPADIRWNELAALIVGHHVSIPLPGGGFVEGEALSVRDDSLVLDIGKTSSASRYPKGQAPIPRASVTEVRLAERRGTGGRILGTVVGALAGAVAGAELAVHKTRSEAAGVPTFTATAVAVTVAGYCAGRSADRHTRLLRIAPAAGAGPQ
jgi:hypothetical protein